MEGHCSAASAYSDEKKQVFRKNKKQDITGRDRLLSNVLWGWGSYFVVFVIGFIMPRLIDRRLGQVELGIWDFSWSLVSYLTYSNLGIGSSVNRYVAKFRARKDIDALRASVSSVFIVQIFIALFIIIIGIIFALALPHYYSKKLGPHLKDCQWVVVLLSLSIAFEQTLNIFRGVISGCHRWDLHNMFNLFSRALAFAGMLMVILMGFGLQSLAIAYLCAIMVAEVIRTMVAYKVCPDLSVRLRYASWNRAREMIFFGWKTIVSTLSPLIVVQTTGVIITGIMGPAIMAVMSRSVALVRHMSVLVDRFSFITTPTAGALQAKGDEEELKKFFLEASRMGVAITLPMVLVFVFLGKYILFCWMGERYVNSDALELLAIGYFLPVSQSPALRILVGLNKHGRVGVASFFSCLFILGAGIVIFNIYGWSLSRAAMLIGVSLTVGNGIVVPVYACKLMGMAVSQYVVKTFTLPIFCNIPILLFLITCRLFLRGSPMLTLGLGVVGGGIVTAIFYLFFILPIDQREKILGSLIKRRLVITPRR